MSVIVRCACGTRLAFAERHEGRYGRCSRCGAQVLIKAASEEIEVAPLDDVAVEGAETGASPALLQPLPGHRGRSADAVVAQPASKATSGSYWMDVGSTFAFFRNAHNLGSYLVVVAVIVLMRFVGGFPFIWLPVKVIGTCWLMSFYLSVIGEVGRGEDSLPTVWISSVWDDLVRPVLLFFASILAVLVPAIVTAAIAPETTDIGVPMILAVVGLFLWPAMILMVTVGDGFRGLRPDLLLRTVLSAFGAYLVTWILLIVAFLPVGLGSLVTLDYLPAPRILEANPASKLFVGVGIGAVEGYTAIVSMRLIGLYYRHFKQRFPWRAE